MEDHGSDDVRCYCGDIKTDQENVHADDDDDDAAAAAAAAVAVARYYHQ